MRVAATPALPQELGGERSPVSGRHVHGTQLGSATVQLRCEQPCLSSPGACHSTFLQRPGNHSFVTHCHSLKVFQRKRMETFPVFSSWDLDSYTKGLPVTLGSQLGLTRPKSFSSMLETEESFSIYLMFLRFYYAFHLTKLQTYF